MSRILYSQQMIKLILVSVFIGVIKSIEHILPIPSDVRFSIEDLFIVAYSSLNITHKQLLISITWWSVPTLLLLYLTSDYIAGQMKNTLVYMITRSGNRTLWIFKQLRSLFYFTFIYLAIQFVFLFIIGTLLGFKLGDSNVESLLVILRIFAVLLLLNFFFVNLTGYLTLFISSLLGFSLVSLFFMGSLVMSGIAIQLGLPTLLLRFLPQANTIATWVEGFLASTWIEQGVIMEISGMNPLALQTASSLWEMNNSETTWF